MNGSSVNAFENAVGPGGQQRFPKPVADFHSFRERPFERVAHQAKAVRGDHDSPQMESAVYHGSQGAYGHLAAASQSRQESALGGNGGAREAMIQLLPHGGVRTPNGRLDG
jgi:hypothetical protein